MKKLISLLVVAFTAINLFGANLIIRNNTNQKMEVSIWLSGVSFYLEPGQEVEFKVRESVNFDCPFGVAWIETEEDTTLELNKDCFYVGESKFYYWNEGM